MQFEATPLCENAYSATGPRVTELTPRGVANYAGTCDEYLLSQGVEIGVSLREAASAVTLNRDLNTSRSEHHEQGPGQEEARQERAAKEL